MSKTWKCRPSEILGITDEIAAYCLDRAVYLFGTAYDADINDAATPPPGSKGKHNGQQLIALTNQRWLNDNPRDEKDESQFEVVVDKKYRDPAARLTGG